MGLLLGKGGLWGQSIRFAPPMCITKADADFILEVFDEAFARLEAPVAAKAKPELAAV
jgi:alanine-glyoxylate transaminase/(R)-3-amino-2-methylpropionate-pyruvate transaminase